MSDSKRRKLPPWMQGRSAVGMGGGSGESAGSILNLSPLTYSGSIIYSYNYSDCALVCEELRARLASAGEMVVGFDMEWPVTFEVGKQPKTALLQICTSHAQCYLFHVACMADLPGSLRELLLDERLKKVGIGIENDFWKLARDFDLPVTATLKDSVINLTPLANEVLNSKENWSLDGLCRHLLKNKLDKESSVRKSDWRKYPLSAEQTQYAALDAYASLLLFEELTKLKNPHSHKPTGLK